MQSIKISEFPLSFEFDFCLGFKNTYLYVYELFCFKNHKNYFVMKKSLFFLVLSIVLPIQAASIYVKPASLGGSDDTGDGVSWETAYATPSKAFSIANTSGDVIAIMQGTYIMTSSLTNTAKTTNISVQGGYTGANEERVLDASNTIFEYAGSVAVRVLADYGAGLVFSGISFQNLQPDASQYGIFVNIPVSANLSLEDCIIKNFVNKAGAYIRGIIRFNGTATLSIDRCQFIDCEEKSTSAHNAVIARNAGNATVIIKNSIIKGTKTKPFISSAAGGTNTHTISNCNFVDNPAGAGVNLSSYFTTTIKNSIFYNSALSGGGTLNNSYYNGSIGTFTTNNSVSFTTATDVFADLTNYYPASNFAGIDNGDNSVALEGDRDVVANDRIKNSTIDIGAYENIDAPIAVAGSNVTSVGTATASYYAYGATAQIPFTVTEGYVPDPIEGVLFTGTSPDYTASLVVKAPQTITFTATQANFEVTVSTTNVTVTAPTLVDGKYSSASSSIIYFTLNEGTENPVVTVNGNPATPVLVSGNDYSLTLTGISGATNVVISATVKVFDVTLSKNAYVATVSGLNEGTQEKEYGYSDLTFTLATGAHSPYVTVNGVVKATTESSGVYSLPGFKITSVSEIVISAFAANVLPVSDDTYQRRGGAISGDYANLTNLGSRGEPAGWAIIPLLKFVPTEAMKGAGYNKAVLRMVPTATVADLTYTVRQFPAGYTSIYDVPANDYTNLMEATLVGTADQPVSFSANLPVELNVTDSYILNFPNEIIISLVKGSNSTVHYLYSLENGNPAYVPALVFSTVISTGDYSIEKGLYAYYHKGRVFVNNANSSEKIQIFDTLGRIIHEELLIDESFALNCVLNNGVYVVKVGNKTIKMMVNN